MREVIVRYGLPACTDYSLKRLVRLTPHEIVLDLDRQRRMPSSNSHIDDHIVQWVAQACLLEPDAYGSPSVIPPSGTSS